MGLLLALAATVQAGGVPTLQEVVVSGTDDGLLGMANSASEGTVLADQLARRPLLRPAEVLETVPGLITTQHSGDGKANQYFLRGFNLDHGTDFATWLMGMPLNMPTHAHGQGYTDLQFLIPELVDRMHYRKGPYGAGDGDFSAAGSARIEYMRQLPHPFAELTLGPMDYQRGLLAGSVPGAASGSWLYALEWAQNNGPWTLPEDLQRLNGVLRYSEGSRDAGWSLGALAYQSRWNATDQVPIQAIERDSISRWGSIDATDGGNTQRYSLSWQWSDRSNRQWTRASAYGVDYGLQLWSNFSYCLNDLARTGTCQRGDQFEQVDQRRVFGGQWARTWYGQWAGREVEWTLGGDARQDRIGALGLYLTHARQRDTTVREDQVRQTSLGLYAEAQVQWTPQLRTVFGLRHDRYQFAVQSDTADNSGVVSEGVSSPKLSIIFSPSPKTELYASVGQGFHSNDGRGITTRINPDPRDPDYRSAVEPSTPLVRAYGHELGLRSAWRPGWQMALAVWELRLDSELVFVGDAGTNVPGSPSVRRGIEWSHYWTPSPGWVLDADLALSRARFVAPPGVANHVPGAVEKTASLGVAWDAGQGWSGGMRLRYLGSRALVEDNSVRSPASLLLNLRVGYKLSRQWRLGVDVLNLLDSKTSDIDYVYSSQLAGEATPSERIHTHPNEPRTLRISLRWQP